MESHGELTNGTVRFSAPHTTNESENSAIQLLLERAKSRRGPLGRIPGKGCVTSTTPFGFVTVTQAPSTGPRESITRQESSPRNEYQSTPTLPSPRSTLPSTS